MFVGTIYRDDDSFDIVRVCKSQEILKRYALQLKFTGFYAVGENELRSGWTDDGRMFIIQFVEEIYL